MVGCCSMEAWNIFHEIVHLYECSVRWGHSENLSEADDDIQQFKEVKRQREPYAHLGRNTKTLQRDGVKKIIDEYAGKYRTMLDRLYRHLVGADLDITLENKIYVLRPEDERWLM